VTDPVETQPVPSAPQTGLADGDWHRLHPATPLLRGGIALIAIAGVIIANLRERLLDLVIGAPGYEGDPIDFLIAEGLVPLALGVVLVGVVLFVIGFWLSWRMHTFRITEELVEVRSGILFRTNRRGRLDRIQGINVVRPLFPRLFGAARLEISVAGNDGNVKLD
jgi:putative membrane protein